MQGRCNAQYAVELIDKMASLAFRILATRTALIRYATLPLRMW